MHTNNPSPQKFIFFSSWWVDNNVYTDGFPHMKATNEERERAKLQAQQKAPWRNKLWLRNRVQGSIIVIAATNDYNNIP